MEAIHKIIPFAKEMWQLKPSRSLMKVYLVGGAVAFFGAGLHLVETVCKPFSSQEPLDEELTWLEEHKLPLEAEKQRVRTKDSMLEMELDQTKKKHQTMVRQRSSANRLHAS